MSDFINNRLNKDNFWNVMFFATFFVGLLLGNMIPQPFGGIVFWLSFVSAILLVKSNTNLSFDKERLEFTTSQGNKVQKAGLMFFWLLFASAILAIGIVALFFNINIKDSILAQLVFCFFFSLFPALYCILRNFPIAVYFKKEAWIGNGKTTYGSTGSDNNFSSNVDQNNFMHSSNYYRDIRNSFSEGNIFHHK